MTGLSQIYNCERLIYFYFAWRYYLLLRAKLDYEKIMKEQIELFL